MLPKGTMAIVVEKLAEMRYIERCNRLDEVLEDSMVQAFKDEKISIERRDRILRKFAKNVLATKLER